MHHRTLRTAVVAWLAVAAAACGGSDTGGPALIRVDGSSTVFPIAEAVAERFYETHPDTRPTVGVSGTGGGFQKFCGGEIDINGASRPIRSSELDACARAGIDFIELPVAYDGLAVVVNPKNTWVDAITVDELKRLWQPEAQGAILRWNQVRPSWPDREIRLFGAGVDSGTYDYFTEAIVGKEGASRGDFTSSEDDNVLVQGVAGDELALGFMPLAYVDQNRSRLKLIGVDDGKADNGNGPIAASAESVRSGTYQPLSRPLFIYISAAAAERSEVQQFVHAYLDSPDLVREVGYIELTPQIYDLARSHFAARRTGSAFGAGGSQVGVTLEDLLVRPR